MDKADNSCNPNKSWLTTHTAPFGDTMKKTEFVKDDIIAMGAEASVYSGKFFGFDVIAKHRFAKTYREKKIDIMLRKSRSIQEVRLLINAKRIGINVPFVLDLDKKEWIMIIEKIDGKPLKEYSNTDYQGLDKIYAKLGEYMGLLHSNSIIHGDLTTSNVLLDKKGEIWIIDFGLGYSSTQIEDKAVDLLVLKHTLQSSHSTVSEDVFKAFLESYEQNSSKYKQIMKRMRGVEERIRYSH